MSTVDAAAAKPASAGAAATSAVATADAAVKPSPQPKGLETASFLSRWSFWWLNGLLTTGFRRALQTEDVPPLPSTERAFDNAERFESILKRVYAKFQPGSKGKEEGAALAPGAQPPSLAWAIYKLVGPAYLSALCFQFISEVLAFAGPVLVQRITGFLEEDSTEPTSNGWIYTALLFALPTIASVCRNQYYLNSWRVAVRLRSAILSSVFRKSLKLSPAARRIVTDGEILTLMSADAQKLADIWNLLFVLFTSPLSILACFVLIWLQVGASTLAGAGVILILMPMNIWLGKVSGSYRREEAAFTDLRMRYVKEAVSNMKVIKQYGWSDSFSERITIVRQKEIAIRRRAAYLEAFSNSILILTPVLISLVTFLTFAGSGHVLTATNVFTSMALFNVMRFQLSQFPLVLTALFEARISLQRILRLFLREELEPESRDFAEELPEQQEPGQPKPEVIRIENASFSWDVSEQGSAQSTAAPAAAVASPPAKAGAPRVPNAGGVDSNWRLSDVTLSVRRGQFVAVVGAVGSGKSSLLSAILGEVARTSGPRVFFRGRVAIVPQTAWILNATLRDNILFGLEKDEERYQRVIDLCCLRADLAQLTAGDSTEIGDRGVNLSGGQRQRCAIARAVYAALSGTVDTILLDDPLSAVDAHVSKALFDRVLSRSGILGKLGVTTILAMNQLHFLPGTDWVVVLKAGRVVQSNTYGHLMLEPAGELAQLMSSYGFDQDEEHKEEGGEKTKKLGGSASSARSASNASAAVVPVGAQPISPGAVAGSKAAGSSAASGPADGSQTLTTAPLVSPTKAGSNLPVPAAPAAKDGAAAVSAKKAGGTTQAEGRVEGSVGFKVYSAYIRASGGWWVLWSILFLFCVHQGGRVGADFWLAAWASQDWGSPKHKLAFWMGIFAAFGAAVTVASLIRSMLFAEKTLAAAYNLHQSMLACIFRSPAAWFDVTPVGRIVNRFSGDCDKLDHLLGRTLEGWGGCVFFVLGTFVAICVVYPYYFAPLLFIIFVYWKIQQYYVASSRELQRLDSISKSPIFSNFGESLQGAASIRAYGVRERFLRINEKHVDANHRNMLAYQAALCWLAVRIELISTLLMTISAIFAVSSRRDTNAALAGLTIVYAITITSFLNFSVRLGSVVEGLMSSVERLDEYSQLTPEAAPRLPGVDPPASWPSRGEIKLESMTMRYRPELDLVLKGVSCEIAPGEKIGIIGRTGSGKSSLMVALFRLVELTSGRVLIDGVDIGKIGLESLRSKITLIPQEPVLFGGTVKYNLDPFDHCSEEQIWRALAQVNLADKIRSMDGGLKFVLSEGESLSVGERQLLCVCRALLRETKILVLDEATASVDIESDNLIQAVLASHFAHATVLAIAHRLSSIMNYDKILVMEAGEVAEFGVPHLMLQNPKSALLSLVEATGPASATYLKAVAKQTYLDKQRGIKVRFGILPSADSFGAEGQTTGEPVEVSAVRWHEQEENDDN